MSKGYYLPIRTTEGVTLAAPATLQSTSTYVLLEQETWFEKELAFVVQWLKPGMTAVDIGANIGVYSFAIARQVGPGGRVIAYEPASEPRQLQDVSRQLNQIGNLEIVASALSDGEGQGRLVFGTSSETNALGNAGPGEEVRISSLDAEDAARAWPRIDFVKIDAEGHETRILAGGRVFFDRHSPLVMFEFTTQEGPNIALRSAFNTMGYDCYRALPGEPILVRADLELPDKFELNLFAMKPECAQRLLSDGFLVDPLAMWSATAQARTAGVARLKARPFAASFATLINADCDTDYLNGLAAFAEWHDRARPLAQRCSALASAFTMLQAACKSVPSSMARLSTFARCAFEWGRRDDCVTALGRLDQLLRQSGAVSVCEPFWPACARYDEIAPPPGKEQSWFLSAAAEQFERTNSFSSLFYGTSPGVAWLCTQPFASAEMVRRRILQAYRSGQSPDIPARLRREAADNLNAKIWADPAILQFLHSH